LRARIRVFGIWTTNKPTVASEAAMNVKKTLIRAAVEDSWAK